LPVVSYGCGTWSLTLREKPRLRVTENTVLRRIFGPKGNEVIGKCKKIVVIRKKRTFGACGMYGEERDGKKNSRQEI